jgi:hypothetical protein
MIASRAMENNGCIDMHRYLNSRSTKHELLTILIRKEDYAKLKAQGGPRHDQIILAFRHYLELLRESDWRPNPALVLAGARVTTFQCAVDKDLCEQIRGLEGRLVVHTLEAIRRFLA